MNRNQDKKGFYAGATFLVWPLLALAAAFKNYRESWAKNVCWAFVAFYGLVFAIGAENQGADIVRYVAGYQAMYGNPFPLADLRLYIEEQGGMDFMRMLISVVLSRFTDSQPVLTLTYGLIFGYFFSRNMWFVLQKLEGTVQWITILLFTCFFLVVPMWDMNGFRMWTAAHVFIYGLLPFLVDGKKRYLLVSACSLLFHFSFIFPLAVLLMYVVFGNRLTAYFAFFMASIFIANIDVELFNRYVESYAPEIIQEESAAYRSGGNVERFREAETEQNWYAAWYGKALSWSVMGYLIIMFITARDFFNDQRQWLNLFCFTLLFYGAANLISSLPSGGRFLSVANLAALPVVILYVQNIQHHKVMRRFIWVTIPLLLLFIVVSFRAGLYSMSATAVLGNPLVALFTAGENVSLNDFMRMIL